MHKQQMDGADKQFEEPTDYPWSWIDECGGFQIYHTMPLRDMLGAANNIGGIERGK